MGDVLKEWTAALKDELGIVLEVDRSPLFALAGYATHGVALPAAPLTTFLVGYAAGQAGDGPDTVAATARRARELAARWANEASPAPGSGPHDQSAPSGTITGRIGKSHYDLTYGTPLALNSAPTRATCLRWTAHISSSCAREPAT
ncbi:DUF6457 domain-containing protein [Streptomyces xiangluensis]|uniref:DUF6457 domain-containing protein n=1 Tax=Streptomyces xiangluensis TaxID=2665720 RepID=A0ABV8YHU6_9ACTN